MRQLLRHLVTTLATIFGGIFVALVYQNIEFFAEERGWHRLLRDGWQAVSDLGLESVVAYAFFFFGGASVALWADLWLRRITSETAREARIILRWGLDGDVLSDPPFSNIQYWYTSARGHEEIVWLLFQKQIDKPHLHVFATREGVKWKELQLSEQHVIIEIEGRQKDIKVLIGAIAESARSSDTRRQQPNVWQEAAHFEEIPDALVYDDSEPGWWRRLRSCFSRA